MISAQARQGVSLNCQGQQYIVHADMGDAMVSVVGSLQLQISCRGTKTLVSRTASLSAMFFRAAHQSPRQRQPAACTGQPLGYHDALHAWASHFTARRRSWSPLLELEQQQAMAGQRWQWLLGWVQRRLLIQAQQLALAVPAAAL